MIVVTVNDSCDTSDTSDSSLPPRNSTNASPSLKSFLRSIISFSTLLNLASILVNLASSLNKLRSTFFTPSNESGVSGGVDGDCGADGDCGVDGDFFLVLVEDLSLLLLFILLQRDRSAVDLFLLLYLLYLVELLLLFIVIDIDRSDSYDCRNWYN